MEPDGATAGQTQTESLSSSPNSASTVALNNLSSAPRFGTVTPNSIFVGGIDVKANENDLREFFAQYGSVEEVKIVNDRAGVSKGYGFITFETQEDAQEILQEAKKLNYKGKKLNIGPAVRKQQIQSPGSPVVPEGGTMYLTTSSGYPYTYHNGVAYFQTSEVAPAAQPWPSRSVSSSPVMVAQPVYQSPTYHYQAPTHCSPSQWQWSVPQSPASSPPVLYLQPSEVIYQPIGIPQENGCVPPPLLVEAAVPELYADHGVQTVHHQPYTQSAIAMPAPTAGQTQTESLSSSPNSASTVALNNLSSAPRFGTVTPNSIFVGGIDVKANENDLREFFAQYGSVKEVKIVNDRAGVSKGYGFITFETQEDAQEILQEAKKLNYKGKKLNIGPAVRKQQIRSPGSPVVPEGGTMYLTTSSGYPYTYHNGVAYFQTSEVAPAAQPWPAPAHCLPGQWQWSVPQSPVSSPPVLYLQPSEVIYQPIGIPQENGCVPPPLLVEAAVPEQLYADHGVQTVHHQPYTQSAIAMPAPVSIELRLLT
ncbi:protein boule-like [Chlamydotis macqueenii]